MTITDVLKSLRRRWQYLFAAIVLGGAVGVAAFTYTVPTYQAAATVYFSVPVATTAGELAQGGNYTQQQLASYAELASKPIVLEPVITKLGLATSADKLADSIDATVSPDTVLTTVTVTSANPRQSADIANAVAVQLGETVIQLSPKAAAGGSAIDYAIAGRASVPTVPTAPNKKLDLGAGLLGGLIVGVLAALARDRLDTRIWGDAELGDVPSLAKIPFDKAASKKGRSPLIIDWVEGSARSEAFRQLRTALQFVDVDHAVKTITVTSSLSAEGKSGVTANLAVAFADAGHRVLLLDADLRRPSIAEYFGLDGSIGLTNVLAGQVEVSDVVQHWGGNRLAILVSGSVPPNPSELLGSERMARLLTRFREDYDVVLIDTPPLLPVTDGAVISAKTDGALVVVRHGKTKRAELAGALEALQAVDAKVVGAVVNRVPSPKRGDSHGYYGAIPTGDNGLGPSQAVSDQVDDAPVADRDRSSVPDAEPAAEATERSHSGVDDSAADRRTKEPELVESVIRIVSAGRR